MEELKLYEGRPADCTGRLEKEIRTYDLLDKLGIQFWRTDHGWMKADTMEDCHVLTEVPMGVMVEEEVISSCAVTVITGHCCT